MTTSPRMRPLPPAEWDDAAREAYAVLDSPATRDVGAASNMSTALANYPKLAKAYYGFGRHLLMESSLPDRPRELVTLRIGWRYKSEYEWHHHVRMGKRVGLSDAEIEAVKEGPEAKIFSESDRTVLRVVDELCEQSKISDGTWNDLSLTFDQKQIMDLVYTVGHYVMVAWALAAFQIGIEPGFDSREHPLD